MVNLQLPRRAEKYGPFPWTRSLVAENCLQSYRLNAGGGHSNVAAGSGLPRFARKDGTADAPGHRLEIRARIG